jgi:UDP-N-acetylglucosamine 3-dehydrogenase
MALMMKLRIAIIGLGNMGRHHVKHSQALAQTELVALCDTDSGRITAAQALAPNVPGFHNIEEMLNAVEVDLACVVVPTSLHAKIAGALLARGIHVLVEKPIASTCQEAQALIHMAKQNNKRLFVGHVEYFNPATQAFFKHIETHEFGSIQHICARRWSPMPHQITDANVILDLCIHDLHIVTQLIASQPLKTTWYEKSHILQNRADSATGILEFPGATASIDANWIVGTHGVAKLDLLHQRVMVSSATNPDWQTLSIEKAWPLETELIHVIDAIQHKTISPIDAEQGLRALQLCL